MAYQGLKATFPLGVEGLTGDEGLFNLRPTQLVVADGITYEGRVIQKEGGAAKYNATPLPDNPERITGGVYWDVQDPAWTGQQLIIMSEHASDARIYHDNAYNGTFPSGTSDTGLTKGSLPVFAEGGAEAAGSLSTMFWFNGLDPPMKKDSNDITFLTTGMTLPADWAAPNWPSFGAVHEGRLWGGGNRNDPHRLYYTQTTNHKDWTGTGSGSISVYPGEGQALIGIIAFKGLLIAFKRRGIYYVDTRAPDTANWVVDRLTSAVGLASPLAAVNIGENDAILWMDTQGVFRLAQGVLEFGNVRTNRLLVAQDIAAYIRREFELGRLDKVQGVYYPHKDQAHFVVTNKGDGINNRRLVLDFQTAPPRVSVSSRDVNEAIFLRRGTDGMARPTVGDDTGTVWDIDTSTRNKDGLAYTGQIQVPATDLGFLDPDIATKTKNGQFIEIMMDPGETAEVDIYWDFVLTQTVAVQANRLQPIHGSGHFVSLAIRNMAVNANFRPSAARLYFTPGNERRP